MAAEMSDLWGGAWHTSDVRSVLTSTASVILIALSAFTTITLASSLIRPASQIRICRVDTTLSILSCGWNNIIESQQAPPCN